MTMNGSLPPSSSTVFLSARPARPATSWPGAFAAGQRHRADARIVEQRRDVGRADQQRLEHAVGKAGAAEDVLDGQRALRHVRRVLEQPDVAGHQRRRGEAEHLPERKVPRHDRQHDAERLVADVALPAPRWARARRRESSRRARRSSGSPRAHFSASSMPARSGFPISSVIRRPSWLGFRFEDVGGPRQQLVRARRTTCALHDRNAATRALELRRDRRLGDSVSNVASVSPVAGLMLGNAIAGLRLRRAVPMVKMRTRWIAQRDWRSAACRSG